jgi:DNA-binding NtrC family response regulator
VPTLNERIEDIPLLGNYFIQQICSDYGIPEKSLTDDAIIELQNIQWTGNIREFRNVIERLIILCDRKITASDILTYAAPLK